MFSKRKIFFFIEILLFILIGSYFFLFSEKVEAITVTQDCPNCALWGVPQTFGPYFKVESNKCYQYYERTIPCLKTKDGSITYCERTETDYNKTEIGCEAFCTGCQTAGCGQISAVGLQSFGGRWQWSGYKCNCESQIGGNYYAVCRGEQTMFFSADPNKPPWLSYLNDCRSGSCLSNPSGEYLASCGVSNYSCTSLPVAWPYSPGTNPACSSPNFCGETCYGLPGQAGGLGGECCTTGCKEGLTCCQVRDKKVCLNSCALYECDTSDYKCKYVGEGVSPEKVKAGYGFGTQSACDLACKPPLNVSCSVEPSSGSPTTSFSFKAYISGGSGTYYCSITQPVNQSSTGCSNGSTVITKTFSGFNPGDYNAFLTVKDSYGREASAECKWSIISAGKPDLRIKSGSFGYDKTQGRFYYEEENVGEADAGSHYVGVFEKDGLQSLSGNSISSLKKGASTGVLYSYWQCPNQTSVYNFYAFADSGEVIDEKDETNNKTSYLTIDCRPAAQPDLIISRLDTTPSSGNPGSSITINIKEKNQGSANASAHYIYLYIDGTKKTDFTVSSLSAGSETTTYNYTYTCPSNGGTHTIKAVADGGGAVTESDESNNEESYTLDCGSAISKPDLDIYNITISPSSPEQGQSVTITVTERNRESTNAGAHYVKLTINGTSYEKYVSGLSGNSTTNLTWTNIYNCPTSSCGSVNVQAIADSQNNVDESNENNNSYNASFYCGVSGVVDLYSNTTSVTQGGNVTLYWTTQYIKSGTCKASSNPYNSSWSGDKGDNNTYPGETIYDLQQSTTFGLTCTDNCGNYVSDSVYISVSGKKYSCNSSSGCIEDSNGPYTSLTDCQNVCKKRCTNANQCGGYSTNTSLPICSSNTDCKKCTSSGTCSTSGTGSWCSTDNECQVRYSCNSSSGCIQDSNGPYTSLTDCQNVCKKRCTNANQCGGYSTNTSLPICSSNTDCKKCTTSGTCSTSGTGSWCTSSSDCSLPLTADLSADRYTINSGERVTLTWRCGNASSAKINGTTNGWLYTCNPVSSGSVQTPQMDTVTTYTYVLYCYDTQNNYASDSVSITVQSPPDEVSVVLNCGSEPDYCTVPYASGANLNWKIQNANCYTKWDNAFWGYDQYGNYLPDPWYADYVRSNFSSSQTVKPQSGGDFLITAYREEGNGTGDCCTSVGCSSYNSDSVSVDIIPPPTPYLSHNACEVYDYNINDWIGRIFYNGSVTFDLGVEIDYRDGEVVTTCKFYQGNSLIGTYTTQVGETGYISLGSKTINNLKNTTTFTLTCSNSKYGSDSIKKKIEVLPQGTKYYSCSYVSGCVEDACGDLTQSNCNQVCKKRCTDPGYCNYTTGYSDRPECNSGNDCHPGTYRCSDIGTCVEDYRGSLSNDECQEKCKKRCVNIGWCYGSTDTNLPECSSNSNCGKCYNNSCQYASWIPNWQGLQWCSSNNDCQKYKCVTDGSTYWRCETDPNGPYSSLNDCQAECVKPPEKCTIDKFTINGQEGIVRLLLNTTSTASWSSSNCDLCKLTCAPIGCNLNLESAGTSGSQKFIVTTDGNYTYTLYCENNTAMYQGQPYPSNDKKTIIATVYSYSWWREIIPQLQPFLRNLLNF